MRLLTCILAALIATPIAALADQGDVVVHTKDAALKGHGWPQIIVDVDAPIMALKIDLKRSDNTEVHLSAGKIGRGAQKIFDLKQPDGRFHYEGELIAKFPKGPPQSMPIALDTIVLPPPKITLPEHPVDLTARTVTVTSDRPTSTVHLVVKADDGRNLDDETEPFLEAKEGEPLVIPWHESDPGTVLQLSIRVTDRYGFYQDIDFFPWKIEIPHEDVLFESGKSEILPAESPKLDAALGKLANAIEKYGRFAKVQLFIAGYTDTVGDAASNQRLSEARATSIGRYFRSHGVRIPISCAGFGEEGLLVPTPDETPEAQNRRAAYIVSIEPPRGVHWTALR